jgi:hypothetical protein
MNVQATTLPLWFLPGVFIPTTNLSSTLHTVGSLLHVRERGDQTATPLSWARPQPTTISELPSGSRSQNSGGTGSPMRLISVSTSTPAAFSSAW